MSSFVKELAQTLLRRHNNDLSNLVMVFPSLRARVFFCEALTNLTDAPLWQPSWSSIDELMERGSGLRRGERIRLITELFKVYKKYHPSEEFDKFYFWGEILISDFDMIDKYLIDANQLLRNIEDIKEIEADVSYLSPEQESIIRSFWSSIGSEASLTEQKQYFLEIWRSLPKIYNEYRERLFKLKIGYTGMLYRATAERIKRNEGFDVGDRRYVIAGFNALSKSEEILFNYLAKSSCGAEFYWDYDSYYVDNREHEAGLFIRNNLSQFAQTEILSHDNFYGKKKQITATACVSNVVQIKHIADVISSIPADELDRQTAIVLTDENLLIPLLHSLPERVKSVNVTMGYPIKTTLAYTFLERMIALQTHCQLSGGSERFYHVDVTGLLTHPYIKDVCGVKAQKLAADIISKRAVLVGSSMFDGKDILRDIFSYNIADSRVLSKYLIDVMSQVVVSIGDIAQREYLRVVIEEVKKIVLSIDNCGLDVSVDVFISLLRRHMQSLSIPFEGEPVEGLQIMGILETRNIDFKNVIILSMSDDTFPGNHTDKSSFIPYALRIAYGVPTHEEHDAMYAYYFYRLIQRAERVDMLYCSMADKRSTGERSRYIYQLEYESKYDVINRSVGVDLGKPVAGSIEISKDDKVMASLSRFLGPDATSSLSPSSFFKYVQCPLKFYLSSVAHLKTPDELEDNIDPLTLGNILHNSMELLYADICGMETPTSQIEQLRNKAKVKGVVDGVIRDLLQYNTSVDGGFSGDTILVRDLITKYIIDGVMRHDVSRKDFVVHSLEDKDIMYHYPISGGRSVALSGRADRVDLHPDGSIEVIDYKTSKKRSDPHLLFNGVEMLFKGKNADKISNIFQILFYAMLLYRIRKSDVVPSLYYVTEMLYGEYCSRPYMVVEKQKIFVERYSMVEEEFEKGLTEAFEELFNPDVPFCQTDDNDICKLCEFKKICRR